MGTTRIACEGCGRQFPARVRRGVIVRRFHNLQCYARWRESQPGWLAARRRGQAKSRETKVRQALDRARGQIRDCRSKAEAFLQGRRAGISIGWKRGQRVGFAQGYDAATKDMTT